jgi:hypothetical protein
MHPSFSSTAVWQAADPSRYLGGRYLRPTATVIACILLWTATGARTAVADDAAVPTVSVSEALAPVTGKRNATPVDISNVLPSSVAKYAPLCKSADAEGDPPAACSERVRFYMNLQVECMYGGERYGGERDGKGGPYCEILAEQSEKEQDLVSAALFRQRACDLGQRKSCGRAMDDRSAALAKAGVNP